MLDELHTEHPARLPDLYELTPIATIEMASRPDDDFSDEPLDWVDLVDYRDTPERVMAPKAPVLKATEAMLLLDYPVDVAATRKILAKNDTAFTRDEVLAAILSTYEAVYDSERLTSADPDHSLDALGVSTVHVYDVDGTLWLTPEMIS